MICFSRLIKLILVLEAAVPSADFVIVTCTVAGRTSGAQALSLAYLLQYMLGMFTMTAATGFAVGWIYEDDAAFSTASSNDTWCLCNTTCNSTMY